MALAGTVLGLIVLLNRAKNPYVRVASIVIAMLVGYVMAYFMGMVDTRQASSSSALVALPIPMQFGLSFDWSLFIPLVLIFLITALEAIGDITATSEVSGEPVKGPVYMKRIKGGVLADGLNSAIAAVFNSFPNSTFSQNNGVILLTGVASRYVGYFIAGMLVLLGLFPGVASFVQLIPEPVLGGATIVMFGTIAAAGVRIISRVDLDRRAILIMALSFSMGLGIAQKPEILQFMPEFIKSIFSSGVAAGGITAIVLNLLLPEKLQDEEEEKNARACNGKALICTKKKGCRRRQPFFNPTNPSKIRLQLTFASRKAQLYFEPTFTAVVHHHRAVMLADNTFDNGQP